LVIAFVAGLAFAILINHPLHKILFEAFYGPFVLTNGQQSEWMLAGIASDNAGSARMLSMAGISTMLLSPFVEELTDRGILFKESEGLNRWQIALLSIAFFSFAHFVGGGFPKVLAIAPLALVFVGLRFWSGSFVYSFAAHVAFNIVALSGWSVF
jgi:membrane protease YdiL (CAAX protease family)